jgi:hypothetical protein
LKEAARGTPVRQTTLQQISTVYDVGESINALRISEIKRLLIRDFPA